MMKGSPPFEPAVYELAPMQGPVAILGEGPLWNWEQELLYWMDINRCLLHSLDPALGHAKALKLDQPVTALTMTADGGMLAMAYKAVMKLDPISGELSPLAEVEPDMPDNRINDAACDRAGRLWLGTMQMQGKGASGSLYSLEPGGELRKWDSGFRVSNGIGFSPDDKVLYFADTLAHCIYAYDFDLQSGDISKRRVLAAIPPEWGRPDGLTVDAEGYIWSALWDGARVIRVSPGGEVDRVLHLKALRPTSCMFGGNSLAELFITSACRDLDQSVMQNYPDSGALIKIRPGVAGISEPCFAG